MKNINKEAIDRLAKSSKLSNDSQNMVLLEISETIQLMATKLIETSNMVNEIKKELKEKNEEILHMKKDIETLKRGV